MALQAVEAATAAQAAATAAAQAAETAAQAAAAAAQAAETAARRRHRPAAQAAEAAATAQPVPEASSRVRCNWKCRSCGWEFWGNPHNPPLCCDRPYWTRPVRPSSGLWT